MKKIAYLNLVILGLFLLEISNAQIRPEYKILVPEKVVLNHQCMFGGVRNIDQSENTSTDPSTAGFFDVVSDNANNLYFTGMANFTTSPPTDITQIYANAGPDITFGSNTTSPYNHTRLQGYTYFLASYDDIGNVRWVTFLTEKPVKLLLEENEDLLYVLFDKNGNGLGINGQLFPPDSTHVIKTIYRFNLQSGSYVDRFCNQYIYDLVFAGNKKIVIYNRQLTSTNFERRYGFYVNNTVVKWQTALNGTTQSQMPIDLYYNSYQHTLWYRNGGQYFRLFFHSSGDSLIAENISRPTYYFLTPPYMTPVYLNNFIFLNENEYLGTCSGNWNNEPVYDIVKLDTAGNLLWKIRSETNFNDKNYIAVDQNKDVWIRFWYFAYYHKVIFETLNKEYYISSVGNIPLSVNPVWKINGITSELMEAYIDGFGNVSSLDVPYLQKLHITNDNKLISTPYIRAVAYYPDENGNFIPYFTTCSSNNLLPSQFMWASFDLDNLISYKKDDLEFDEDLLNIANLTSKFYIYPNPSNGQFIIHTSRQSVFELCDLTGKVIKKYEVNSNYYFVNENLSKGVYFIRKAYDGSVQKLVIQ